MVRYQLGGLRGRDEGPHHPILRGDGVRGQPHPQPVEHEQKTGVHTARYLRGLRGLHHPR